MQLHHDREGKVTKAFSASNLTYTGSAQTLISSAAEVTAGNQAEGSITYSLDGTSLD